MSIRKALLEKFQECFSLFTILLTGVTVLVCRQLLEYLVLTSFTLAWCCTKKLFGGFFLNLQQLFLSSEVYFICVGNC